MNPEEQPRSGSEPDLAPHPLAPEPERAQPAEAADALTTLVGFVGRSAVEGHVRVYLDLSFTSYCEVATADIARTRPVDPGDEESPTVIWVKSSARMGMVSVGRLSGNAAYVTGAIRARHRQRAVRRVPVANASLDPCTQWFDCWRDTAAFCPAPDSDWCLTEGVPCPSNQSCPSDPMWCGPEPDPVPELLT